MTFKLFVKQGLKASHVWPVAILAFGFGPALAIYQCYHQIQGPDCRVLKNFETNDDFSNKKFKYFHTFDYKNFEHPRPKF